MPLTKALEEKLKRLGGELKSPRQKKILEDMSRMLNKERTVREGEHPVVIKGQGAKFNVSFLGL